MSDILFSLMKGMFAINGYKWNQVGSILIGLIILILIVEVFSNKIRSKLAQG